MRRLPIHAEAALLVVRQGSAPRAVLLWRRPRVISGEAPVDSHGTLSEPTARVPSCFLDDKAGLALGLHDTMM